MQAVLLFLVVIACVFAQTPCGYPNRGCSSQVLKSSCENPLYTGCTWSCTTGGASCNSAPNPECKNHNCCQTIPNCVISSSPTTAAPTLAPTTAAPTTKAPTPRPSNPVPTKQPTKAPTTCQASCPSITTRIACQAKSCCAWGGPTNPICFAAEPTGAPTRAACEKLAKIPCQKRPDCVFVGGKCQTSKK